MARTLAKEDPVLFFQTYRPPIIIDEVQKAPELFEQIKIMCDESQETGLFWLTSSGQYGMMKNIRETLAGRVGILTLYTAPDTVGQSDADDCLAYPPASSYTGGIEGAQLDRNACSTEAGVFTQPSSICLRGNLTFTAAHNQHRYQATSCRDSLMLFA